MRASRSTSGLLLFLLACLSGCILPPKVSLLGADLTLHSNTSQTAEGETITQTRSVGGGQDSISLWLSILLLGLAVPLSYPLQRRFRKWKQTRDSGGGDRGWLCSYSEWGSDCSSPILLTRALNGSAKQSPKPAGTPSSPSTG